MIIAISGNPIVSIFPFAVMKLLWFMHLKTIPSNGVTFTRQLICSVSLTAFKRCKVKFNINTIIAFVSLIINRLLRTTGLGQRSEIGARWAVRESDCGLDDPTCFI